LILILILFINFFCTLFACDDDVGRELLLAHLILLKHFLLFHFFLKINFFVEISQKHILTTVNLFGFLSVVKCRSTCFRAVQSFFKSV